MSNDSNNKSQNGLGDIIEFILKLFGITQERFKKWFGLKDCGCDKRKSFLNKFKWPRAK